MPDKRYTQKEHEDRDDVSVALIQQDMKYVRADIAEIKAELHSSKTVFLTKEEAGFRLAELTVRIKALENINANEAKDRKFYKQSAIGAVISNVVTLVLGALLAVRLYGGH